MENNIRNLLTTQQEKCATTCYLKQKWKTFEKGLAEDCKRIMRLIIFAERVMCRFGRKQAGAVFWYHSHSLSLPFYATLTFSISQTFLIRICLWINNSIAQLDHQNQSARLTLAPLITPGPRNKFRTDRRVAGRKWSVLLSLAGSPCCILFPLWRTPHHSLIACVCGLETARER